MNKLTNIEQSLHDWLDKCPSSAEIIEDEDGYWDIRVKVEED